MCTVGFLELQKDKKMDIWIVVEAKRGFIQEPEIFLNHIDAEERKKVLMADFKPDYDEIEIFHKRINLP